jgi:hypothetical protein
MLLTVAMFFFFFLLPSTYSDSMLKLVNTKQPEVAICFTYIGSYTRTINVWVGTVTVYVLWLWLGLRLWLRLRLSLWMLWFM